MRYCPNPACAYAVKHRRPLEYRDGILACADCGTALVDQAPALPAAAAAAAPRPAAGAVQEALRRLGITAIAAFLIGAGLQVPLFGLQTSVVDDSGPDLAGLGPFPLLAFGAQPFVSGFLLVELVALIVPPLRRRRVGSAEARAPLDRAALLVGVALLAMQIAGTAQYVASLDPAGAIFPPAASLWGQYLAAHLGLLAVIGWVSRSGLVNGFALAVLVEAARAAFALLGRLRGLLADGLASPGPAALLALLLIGGAFGAARLSRSSRPSWGEPGPTAVPFPVSGLAQWAIAFSLLSLPSALAGVLPAAEPIAELILGSPWIFMGLGLFLALDVTLALGFLFFRPRAVGRLWARWVKGADELEAVARARGLLPRALLLAAAVTAVMALERIALNQIGPLADQGLIMAELILGTLVLLDLADEHQARLRLGALVPVRPLHRMAEVEPVGFVLRRAGIPFFARSTAYRAAFQFFAPQVPVEILVPRDRADEARRALDGA